MKNTFPAITNKASRFLGFAALTAAAAWPQPTPSHLDSQVRRSSANVELQPMSADQAARWRTLQAVKPADGPTRSTIYSGFVCLGYTGSQWCDTVISIVNSSQQPVSFLAEFFALDGTPLMVPFLNQSGNFAGNYSAASGTFSSGQEGVPNFQLTNNPAQYGWVRITSDTPGALWADVFSQLEGTFQGGLHLHAAGRPVSNPIEIGVENDPSSKRTWISVINPNADPVTVSLTERNLIGAKECDASTLTLMPNQQIWKAVQSLTCVPSGAPNYTLRLEPSAGVVVQAYYDYGNFIYAATPVHEIVPN